MTAERPERPERRRSARVRLVESRDFAAITELCLRTYPGIRPWSHKVLARHREIFPEGQFVAVSPEGQVVGYAASLIVYWNDYQRDGTWKDFTAAGTFENHDPVMGRTLYGAEVMVDPDIRGLGVGGKLYDARRKLAVKLGLLRIRAGARLRNYHKVVDRMSAEEYAIKVVRGELKDPTLTFQLNRGFDVLAVVQGYLTMDPESLGWAALIEWLNPQVATDADRRGRDPRFARPVTQA